jgi:hypothetical protein
VPIRAPIPHYVEARDARGNVISDARLYCVQRGTNNLVSVHSSDVVGAGTSTSIGILPNAHGRYEGFVDFGEYELRYRKPTDWVNYISNPRTQSSGKSLAAAMTYEPDQSFGTLTMARWVTPTTTATNTDLQIGIATEDIVTITPTNRMFVRASGRFVSETGTDVTSIQLQVDFFNAAGALLSTQNLTSDGTLSGSVASPTAGQTFELGGYVNAVANAAFASLRIRINKTNTSGSAITHWTNILLTKGSTSVSKVPDYFDGDTVDYSWWGNAHSSYSDGPRVGDADGWERWVWAPVNAAPAGTVYNDGWPADSIAPLSLDGDAFANNIVSAAMVTAEPGWTAPSFLNGFLDNDAVNFANLRYRKTSAGYVEMHGVIKAPAAPPAAKVQVCQLGTNGVAWPESRQVFPIARNILTTYSFVYDWLIIETDGSVHISRPSANATYTFDGVRFWTA